MTTEATTETAATPTNTIHDAIDALFASKEPAAAATATEPASDLVAEPATDETSTEGDEAPAEPAAPEAPKLSAADYAIQLAKARKKLAAAKTAPATPAPALPSAAAIKRAAALEAAGDDPLKAFEAAGLDLAAVVQAYDKRMKDEPEYPDPLAKEVKSLAEKLAHYEEREKAAEDAASTTRFLSAAEQMVKAAGDEFKYVARKKAKGLELVKELVLGAAEGDEKTPPYLLHLGDALKMAEAYYSAEAAELVPEVTKPQTKKKPGLPQQSSAAGAAPVTQTRPRTVQDVINAEIDALLG